MVGGDFQKPVQLLVAYGYCVFGDDACVDPSDALDGRPVYTNITFSELFVLPCVDLPKVMDEGPNHATTPFFGVLCWGYMPPCVGAP